MQAKLMKKLKIRGGVYDQLEKRAKEKDMTISEYVSFLLALDRKDV